MIFDVNRRSIIPVCMTLLMALPALVGEEGEAVAPEPGLDSDQQLDVVVNKDADSAENANRTGEVLTTADNIKDQLKAITAALNNPNSNEEATWEAIRDYNAALIYF